MDRDDDVCSLAATRRTGRGVVDQPSSVRGGGGRRLTVRVSTQRLARAGRTRHRRPGDTACLEQTQPQFEETVDRRAVGYIIGRSPAMEQLFQLLPQFAQSNSTILVEGASGTGKELFARAIHDLSPRRDKTFIAVNCGALPDTLLESELFGYKAGAFTDARQDKPGRFALADGGTIFLDEVGDVSPAMQIKLLRVLQERIFEPLGSVESVKVDVRVIAATNQDLGELVRKGTFREDLYYRINIVRLQLPPLCERREDIPLLVEHFVEKFNRLQGKCIGDVSDEVLASLMAHDFPGNIRELENILEYAFVLCRGTQIEPQHLPPGLRERPAPTGAVRRKGLTLRDLETLHIRDALRRCRGNRAAAARELGIDASTLFRKLRTLRIQVAEGDGRTRKPR
jgi:transcriptional regulator with PAS, ATPase and Fis domain